MKSVSQEIYILGFFKMESGSYIKVCYNLYSDIYEKLDNQVSDQVNNKVWDKVRDQISKENIIYDTIKTTNIE